MCNSRFWLLVLAMVVGACARQAPSEEIERKSEMLRDVSSMAVGRGYDRALELEREDCFARDAAMATPVQLWEGTGFSVFTENELGPKLTTAVRVGVKVASERPFGESIGAQIGSSGELPHFAMLARFTARREESGSIRAASAACALVPSNSRNGAEDFVSTCGDRALSQKVYGAHVLVTWRRATTRPTVDELMATMFGARTVGATLDPLVNLAALSAQGLGKEEVFIETLGVPFAPTPVALPRGGTGFTVDSTRAYFLALAQNNVNSFSRVVDYSMVRFSTTDIDLCLAETRRQSALDDRDWVCVGDHIDQLADARDGEGDLGHLRDQYELHRLALNEQLPAGRVVFNTVPQARCQVDLDGDPELERSGPCQEQALTDFVKFFENCALLSSRKVTECRSTVLPDVLTCRDFEGAGCLPVQATLSDGTVVGCDEAGVNAALGDVIPYQVRPPFTPQTPPTGFTPPLVLQFGEMSVATPIAGVSAATDLCGITGVSGGLHESNASVWVDSAGEWLVINESTLADRDRKASIEVTCVKLENFFYLNGGSAPSVPTTKVVHTVPLANGAKPYEQYVFDQGNPMLSGWNDYLDEPTTSIYLNNPDSTGLGRYFGRDLFPLVSTWPSVTSFSINANAPRSGLEAGGSLVDVSQTSGYWAYGNSSSGTSIGLRLDAFCYFVGLSGRYFNVSDSARITTSDGFKQLSVSTPLNKDRNPGAKVQCAYFDRY